MKKKILVAVVAALLVAGVGWYVWYAGQSDMPVAQKPEAEATGSEPKVLYWYDPMRPEVHFDKPGKSPFMDMALEPKYAEVAEQKSTASSASSERKVLYWYDPMRPDVHFDKPGQSPFMDMALEPKYANDDTDDRSAEQLPALSVDARMVQKLGMRTAPVEKGTFWQRIDTTGAIVFDESRTQVVEARVSGWVRQLQVRSVDAPIKSGESLLTIYSPDLLAAQKELLIAQRSGDEELLAATRERLALLGISSKQIQETLATDKAAPEISIVSPASGVLTELNVREGSQVSPGMPIARVASLDRVWVMVDVPESQADWLRGQRPADVQVPALPQRTFEAKVDYLYPQIDTGRRTMRARLVIDNRDLALRPGMSASVTLYGGPRHDVLQVPDAAVIRSGQHDLVIVAEGEGRFRPTVVTVGAQRNGMTVIESGLEENMQVVVSGQFLLESEANLQGALSRLEGSSDSTPQDDGMGNMGDTP